MIFLLTKIIELESINTLDPDGLVEDLEYTWSGETFLGTCVDGNGDIENIPCNNSNDCSNTCDKKASVAYLLLKKHEITNSLVILDKISKDKIYRSTKNIPNIKVTDVHHLSLYDIVRFKKIVFTESSIKELEKRYS